MSEPADWQRVKSILGQALETPPPERAAFLEEACSGDPRLREEVESLLGFGAEHGDSALDEPPVLDSLPGGAGTRIAGFELIDVLGMGGMGIVYRARQERPRREVALKLMRPGIATPAMMRRFELEAELVGRLEHPGIARVYEAGTVGDEGARSPWFAMELVDGPLLSEYLGSHDASLRERIELVARIADAVQHAHAHGVIHRDLKPGNVLVDAEGQPRVVDFGVARLADARETVATRAGELVGTLMYMSPEQAAGSGDIDTRADVYALGAILHECLAGVPPHDLSELAVPAAIERVLTREPPSLAARDRRLRGDLDTICRTAMAKDPERRYPTAAALAADLRRYLAHEPITARPASAAYHMRMFARRHRALVAGALATLLALLGGLVLFGWQKGVAEERFEQAETARIAEEKARRKAEAHAEAEMGVVQFFVDLLLEGNPAEPGASKALVSILEAASMRTQDRLGDHPFALAALHVALSRVHNDMDDVTNHRKHAEAALAALARVDEKEDGFERLRADALFEIAELAGEGAREKYIEALEIYEDEDRDNNVILTARALAWLERSNGRPGESLAWHRRAMRLSKERADEDESFEHAHASLMVDHARLLVRLDLEKRADEVLAAARRKLDADKLAEHPLQGFRILMAMGEIHFSRGRYQDALESHLEEYDLRVRLWGREHRQTVGGLHRIANDLAALGRHEESVVRNEQAIEILQRSGAARSTLMAEILTTLGHSLTELGREDEAVEKLALAVEIKKEHYAEHDHRMLNTICYHAFAVEAARGVAAAAAILERAVEVRRGRAPPASSDWGHILAYLGKWLAALKRPEEAWPHLEAATLVLRRMPGTRDADLAAHAWDRVAVLTDLNRHDDAIRESRELIEMCEGRREPALTKVHALASAGLAKALLLSGKPKESLEAYRVALKRVEAVYGPDGAMTQALRRMVEKVEGLVE